MAIWPPVPPTPPEPVTARAVPVLDAIHDLEAVPADATADEHADAIRDLQHVTADAYRAYTRALAAVQPEGAPRGILSLAELMEITGMSINAVRGAIRAGRRHT